MATVRSEATKQDRTEGGRDRRQLWRAERMGQDEGGGTGERDGR
jgi:hypothetical protein